MPLTLDDLTVNFEHVDRAALLADWEWLIGPHRLPILITALGHAFVQDTGDGTVHQLDTVFGVVEQVAASEDELRALLGDREFVIERLTAHLVADLRSAGLVLGPGQVYSFKTPPALGGAVAVDNAEIADLEVHLSLIGQLHRQIADLPEGTPISEVRLEGP
ncbi:MAG TPA: T6SS immunity protein Tdi1 domain-containing protein [Solirubrobacteraceae bacterium]|nr:T6SS immunity protein Tdi1 domain-containing protein [Solirubrobacteraceae bacterium]